MSIYALLDCNNFYVSCERVFNPSLEKIPVAILSNNDGCIIARSNEVKKLNIPMGAPYYQYKELLANYKVKILSSNYSLYGDLSQRVMEILYTLCPKVEVYSIDEAFLLLDSLEHVDLVEYAAELRKKILQWTGIPVSIGIAHTKVLAKLANHYAKKQTASGVYDLRSSALCDIRLAEFNAGEIWGIGRKLTEHLKKLGIHTAKQLRDSNPKIIRKHFSVTAERIVLELNGISCIGMELAQPKKNITASRSFGKKITELYQLEEAISNHIARACARLREQNSKAQGLIVFLQTSLHQKNIHQTSRTQNFLLPISDTCIMIKAAKQCIKILFSTGISYRKCGVILTGIVPHTLQQFDLFLDTLPDTASNTRMQLLDAIQTRVGPKALFLAAQGIKRPWEMRANQRSPNYTTQWQDLPVVLS